MQPSQLPGVGRGPRGLAPCNGSRAQSSAELVRRAAQHQTRSLGSALGRCKGAGAEAAVLQRCAAVAGQVALLKTALP
jgi:hypothetical protein